MAWHHNVLRYISKDAFVMTAMWGDAYADGSQKAYFLTFKRNRELGHNVVNYTWSLLFCSKFVVSFLSGLGVFFCCIYFDKSPTLKDLTLMDSPMVPFLYTWFTTLFLSTVFFSPFEMI